MFRTPPNKGRVDFPVSFTLRMNALQAAWIKKRGGAPVVRQAVDAVMATPPQKCKKCGHTHFVGKAHRCLPAWTRSMPRPDASAAKPTPRLTKKSRSGKTRKPQTV